MGAMNSKKRNAFGVRPTTPPQLPEAPGCPGFVNGEHPEGVERKAPRPQQQAGARESRQGTAEGGDNGRADPAWIALQIMLLRIKAQVARAMRERDGR